MNHTEFFSSLKNGNLLNCYLFEGTEEYIKQQALKRLEKTILPEGLEELNLTVLEDPKADEMISACETIPFMADRRVVVVNESALLSASKKSDDADPAIIEYMEHLPPTVCLVFFLKGKADGRKKLYTLLKKNAWIVDFSPMGDAECQRWVIRSLSQKGKSITADTASYLIFTVGKDAALLTQEMEKLVSYSDQEEITRDAIDTICIPSTECTVFQMVDAQVAGNLSKTFQLLNQMLKNGEERMAVLAMLLRQYRIMYHLKCLSEEGTPSSQWGALVGIPPFAVTRTLQQTKPYSRKHLKAAYDYLTDTELRLKQGLLPQNGCAENAILALQKILNEKD